MAESKIENSLEYIFDVVTTSKSFGTGRNVVTMDINNKPGYSPSAAIVLHTPNDQWIMAYALINATNTAATINYYNMYNGVITGTTSILVVYTKIA